MAEDIDFSNPEGIKRILLTHEWQKDVRDAIPDAETANAEILKIKQDAVNAIYEDSSTLKPLGAEDIKEVFVAAARTDPRLFISSSGSFRYEDLLNRANKALGTDHSPEAQEITDAAMRAAIHETARKSPNVFLDAGVLKKSREFFGLKEVRDVGKKSPDELLTQEDKKRAFARYWNEEHAQEIKMPVDGSKEKASFPKKKWGDESGYERATKIFGFRDREGNIIGSKFENVHAYLESLGITDSYVATYANQRPHPKELDSLYTTPLDVRVEQVDRYAFEEYIKDRYGNAPDAFTQSYAMFKNIVRESVGNAVGMDGDAELKERNADAVLSNI